MRIRTSLDLIEEIEVGYPGILSCPKIAVSRESTPRGAGLLVLSAAQGSFSSCINKYSLPSTSTLLDEGVWVRVHRAFSLSSEDAPQPEGEVE